jgi:hypothetical protein
MTLIQIALEIILTTFLTDFQDIWTGKVAARVLARFFHIWKPMATQCELEANFEKLC